MFRRSLLYLFFACLVPIAAFAQHWGAPSPREKTTWNYDGGISLATDGSIPEGPCFRLYGHLTSSDFFDNLRREDTNSGTLFRRGNQIISEFPEAMRLGLVLYDRPCSNGLQDTGTRIYLTKSMISAMRLNFAWKHGLELRPAREIRLTKAEAHPILPYAQELAKDLPEKYEWAFEFDVPAKSVPLTDSLVIIFKSPTGHIIARVAARL